MDRSLVERARAGDRDAFAQLASGSVDRCYATARAVLRDADRADDAVQAALVRCWRDLPQLKDPDRFDAWLRRILMHAITDEARGQRRHVARIQVLREHPVIAGHGQTLEDRDQIERALGRLTVAHRAILTLHFLQELSITEVADALGIPTGTAKSRLHYAIDAVRAALEADERVLPRVEVSR